VVGNKTAGLFIRTRDRLECKNSFGDSVKYSEAMPSSNRKIKNLF
jgi:hypothetical protein